MFANIRIFSAILAMMVLIVSIVGSYWAKQHAITHFIIEPLGDLSVELQHAYSKNIWNRYYPIINYIKEEPETEWTSLYQYQSFVLASAEYLESKDLLKARVLSTNKKVLFDSNEQLIISGDDAMLQTVISEMTEIKPDYIYKELDSRTVKSTDISEDKMILTISIPLVVTSKIADSKQVDADNAQAVIEFYYDVSKHYRTMTIGGYLITIILALIIAPILALLLFASKKVEELIEKQQEASLELASAKAVAESESKAKSQFLANISHELRTPLNAIIGFSEIISNESMGALNNDKYKEFIHDIHVSGVHLLSLINDILDFSKAQENKLHIDFEQVDLTKTIKICLRMLLTRAEEAKIQLVDEVPHEHIIIMGDPKRTKQIVLNLLSNAVKFTPEGGHVTIKVWKNIDNNSVVMQIKDSGVGMAAQDLARALSPFGQVENKLSKRFEGTGLGLPLTKKLIEMMHGTFEIQSEPGFGTTITITFAFHSNEIEV